jgi:hypothetical protein
VAVFITLCLVAFGRLEGFGHRSLHQRRIGRGACAGAHLNRSLTIAGGRLFDREYGRFHGGLESQLADRRLSVTHTEEFQHAVLRLHAAQLAKRGRHEGRIV